MEQETNWDSETSGELGQTRREGSAEAPGPGAPLLHLGSAITRCRGKLLPFLQPQLSCL